MLGMWSAATATYFAFRDDVLTRLIARQAEMQYAYEDRIAELRSKVGSHHQPPVARSGAVRPKTLDQIMKRQTALESAPTALGARPDAAVTGSIKPARRGYCGCATTSSGTPKPSPISDTVIFVAPPDREAPTGVARPRRHQGTGRTSSPRIRVLTIFWSACRPRSIRSKNARWRR